MAKPSPTSRSLAECRALGLQAQVVERFNHYTKTRLDLFDCIDVVACGEGFILGIQACAGASHAARMAKAKASPKIAGWLAGGGLFEVWSWAKRGGRGKRKVWTCRKERLGVGWIPVIEHHLGAAPTLEEVSKIDLTGGVDAVEFVRQRRKGATT